MRHFAGIFTDTQRGTSSGRCWRIAAPMALAAALSCALLSLNPAVALALDVTVTTNAASGPGSLAQAVADINARPEAETNTISFASSLSGQTITLDSGVYLIKQMSILNDLAASGVTISSSDIDGSLAAFFYPLSLGGSSPLTISSTGGKGLHARYTGNNESIGSIGSQVSVLGSNASTTPGAKVRSYGIYGDQGLVMSGAMAGAVSSTTVAVRGDNYSTPTTAYAYGLAGLAAGASNPNALVLSSGLSGTVTATATISNSFFDYAYAYGLYADTAMHGGAATSTTTPLTISGSVSATATAKGSYAYGVYSGSSAYLLPLTISGSVTATSNNGTWPSGAYGVYASGPLDLLLTGSINTATHSDIGGTTLHHSGVAIHGGAGSNVTLNPGANWGLTGDVELSGGNSRLTLLGTGTIADYIWGITYLVVGDGTTPANWTLKPTVHSYDNLSIAANAAATINTSRAVQLYGSVVNNGALTYWTSFPQGTTYYYGAISGTGSLTVYGALGNMEVTSNLMAANTYSGATTVSAGTLAAGTGGAFSPNSAFILANGDRAKLSLSGIDQTIAGLSGGGTSGGEVALGSATLTVNGGGSFAGFISGTGGLTKAGSATLTLSGANTYTGATTVNAGTLQAGAANVLTTSSGVALANTPGATLDLNNYDQTIAALSGGGSSGGNVTLGSATLTVQNALDNTYAGVISGTGGLTKADSGTLTLSGANSYSGATTVNAGRFKAGATGAFSSASAVTLANTAGATLDLNNFSQSVGGLSGGGSSGGNVTLGSATLTVNGGGSYDGVISGTGGLIKAGAGTLTLSGVNAYSGGTAINAGTLAVSSGSNLGTGALSLNGGTLENAASFASAKTVSLGASGSTFQTDAGTTLGLSGVISGTGGLTKTGTGTLVLSGANTYSGATTVNAGTLQAGAADVLRTSSGVALANTAGATLDLSGFNQTIAGLSGGGTGGGNVSLGSATLTVQNTLDYTYAGAISGTGGLVKSGSGTQTLSGVNTYTGTTAVNAGVLSVTGSLNSGSISVASGTTLNFSGSLTNLTSLTNYGSINLTSALTFSDSDCTIVSTGSILAASSSAVAIQLGAGNDSVTLGPGATVRGIVDGSGGVNTLTLVGSVSLDGEVRNFQNLVKKNAGAWTISGDVDLGTGTLSVIGGTLTLEGGLTSSGASIASGAGLAFSSSSNTSYSGVISGAGSLTKAGTGTLTLSGANINTGETSVTGGTLQAGATGTLSSASAVSLANTVGVTLDLNNYGQTIAGLSGGGLSGGNVTLGSAILTVQNVLDTTYAGVISGTGGLTKTGSAVLTLSGANTYSGATTVNAGTLKAGATGAFSSTSAVTLANTAGAALDLNNYDQTIAGLSGGGLSGGNVALGSATLTVQNALDTTYAGVISGTTGGLVKTGAGTLTLSGANTYSGGTAINAGTLAVSSDNNLGTGSLAVNGGTLENTASFASAKSVSLGASGGTFLTDTGTTLGLSGVISGTGGLTKTGAGTLTLSGANTNSGTTTVSVGTLQAGAPGAFSSGSAIVLADTFGAALNLSGFNQTIAGLSGGGSSGGNVTLGSATLTVQNTLDYAYAGGISGTGGLTKTGAGMLTLSGANTYTGATTVSAGTLQAGASGAFSAGSAVTLANTAGATLDLNAFSQTVAGLSGGGTSGGNVTLGSATLTVSGGGSYAGVISGTGGLTKTGAGTLTLSGTNTYSDATTVSAGTLRAGATDAFSSGSAVTLANSAGVTLDLNNYDQAVAGLSGGGTSGGNVILGSATLTVQNVPDYTYAGAISGTGGLTKAGTGTLTLSGANAYTGATTVSAGTLQAGGASVFSSASAVSVASGATLALNNNNQTIAGLSGSGNVALGSAILSVNAASAYSFSGSISGTGGLGKSGSGTLTLSGVNTYTGTTAVSAGVLSVTGSLATGSISVASGATLNFSGSLTNLTSLTNYGTITLTSALTFSDSDSTIVSTGSILAASSSAVAIQLGAGNDSVTLGPGATVRGIIDGSGGVNTLTLVGSVSLDGEVRNFQNLVKKDAGSWTISGGVDLGTGILSVTGGTLTLEGDLTSSGASIASGATLAFSSSSNTSYSGVISGAGSLTKAGTGTLTLSGGNTYTGATTVNAGTLQAGVANAFSSGSAVILANSAGVTLDLNNYDQTVAGLSGGGASGGNVTLGSATLTVNGGGSYAGVISGTGGLAKTGVGTLTLSSANTYSGGTAINGGTLAVSSDSNLGTGDLTFDGGTLENTASFASAKNVSLGASGGTFLTDSGTTLTLSGVISGPGGLTKTGDGTLVFVGTNTYSGATTVSAGTLAAGAANVFSADSAITLATGATLDLNNFNQTISSLSGGNVALGSATLTMQTVLAATYGGVISGTGGLIKSGSGTLTLTGTNAYTGSTTVTGGVLSISSDSNVGSGALTLNGGGLQSTASFTSARNISLGSSGGSFSPDASTTLTLNGVLSGAGSLTMNGLGTLALTGVNTYTGGTVLNAGTVDAASWASVGGASNPLTFGGGTLLIGGVNALQTGMDVGAGIVFNTGTGTLTVPGTLTGAGTVTKLGTGTLSLTGTNTYAGGTILNEGTVSILSNSNLGTGPITFNGCTLQFTAATTLENAVSLNSSTGTFNTNGNAVTLSGVVSGSGVLVKNGSGTLSLRGTNTYSGGTVINGGVINIVSDSNLGDPSGGIAMDNGTLQVSADVSSNRNVILNSGGGSFDTNGSSLALNGILSGVGTLTKLGGGPLTLRGTNTYTGGTVINDGMVNIVSDANLGDSTGSVTFNGGMLQAGATLATSRNLTVLNGGGGLDNGGNAVTLNGMFTGAGTFTFTGTGTATVAGNGSGYTGQAILNAGTLIVPVTGSLGGTLTTASGTTIGGYGTLGNLINNGLVSPGGSIGTLNVAGNYVQGSSAVFLDEIDPSGRGDLLSVGGNAQLNGGLLFVSAPIAYYPTGALWPVITAAGGQTGSFASVAQSFASYVLHFLPVSTSNTTLVMATRTPYAAFAANGRAASAGWGLTKGAFSATGAFANMILGFDLANPITIASSLNQLHPEPYDAYTQSGFDSGRLVTASIQGRLNSLRTGDTQTVFASPFDISPSQSLAFNELTQGAPMAAQLDAGVRFGVFLQPFGMTAKQGGTGGRTAYGYNSWGMLGGMDFALSKNSVAGVFGGYSGRNLRLSAPANDNGRADTAFMGGYYTYHTDKWFVESSLRVGLDSYKAHRSVSSPAGSSKVGAAWNGWNLYANVGAGYDWHAAGWVLCPLGAVEFARIAQNGYEESGGGSLGLRVQPRADASLQTSLGFKVARPMEFDWGVLIPEIRVVWGHEWLNGSRNIVANFQGFENTSFTTKTVPPASDWAAVSAGITVKCANSLSFTARVSTDLFRQDYQALAGSLGVRYSF